MALNNVPLAGQTLGVTRVPINQNFSLINAAFLVDHVEYNIAGQGRHQQVSMTLKAPGPVTTIATTNGFFAQNWATTTKDEMWIQTAAGVGTNQYPMSASVLSQTPLIGNYTTGWTYLPSGIVMKWGNVSVNTNSTVTVTLNGIGPNYGAIFSVQLNGFQGNVWSLAGGTPAASFQIVRGSTSSNGTVLWMTYGRE